jgi:hypothetical protein
MAMIKSISGIRGEIGGPAGNGLTPLDIVKFVSAYATWVKNNNPSAKKIVVGRDARMSGEMVRQVVCGTLMGMGLDVVDIGLASTPTTELAVTWLKADGGLILTASHNPRHWNALKLLNNEGEFLSATDGNQVLAIAESEAFNYADVDGLGKYYTDNTMNAKHIDSVLALELVDVEAIKNANFSVAIDCVNSVGGVVLPELLEKLGKGGTEARPGLVITDSQVFGEVARTVPADIPLTSFSILMARYKGFLESALAGVKKIDELKDGDVVLISEGCTHHRQCGDIGTEKIPAWIRKKTGADICFETSSGTGFPEDLSRYALIIHCGACMLNDREVRWRMKCAKDQGIPFTNYGTAIAYMRGILDRSTEIVCNG